MTDTRPQIIIEISQGTVRGVYCSDHTADVTVVDWDSVTSHRGRHTYSVLIDNRREVTALVYPLELESLSSLQSSDTLAVLNHAGSSSAHQALAYGSGNAIRE